LADEFTEEWQEAQATNPAASLIYDTLEVFHQRFAAPWYLVQDADGGGDTINFGIEDDAIFNAGTMVPFMKTSFITSRPEVGVGRVPECSVTIDNVRRLLTEDLMDAVEIQASLTAIFRQYVAPDLSVPKYGPVQFVVSSVKLKGNAIMGVMRIDNLANKKFPNKVHTITEYPGLLPG
jgi:hypothetical protein